MRRLAGVRARGRAGVAVIAIVLCATGATAAPKAATIVALDGNAMDFFGNSVAVSGDTALVGAPGVDEKGAESGAAYVYTRLAGAWQFRTKLTASDGEAGDGFGVRVALDGGVAVIGAHFDDDNGTDSGAAYLFTGSGSSWVERAKLKPSDGEAGDGFGNMVAISGGTVLVGAYLDDDNGVDGGSAYVFVGSGSTWTQQGKLTASDGDAGDLFGASVSIDGDNALIGALHDDPDGLQDAGSAYVFRRAGGAWTQSQKLVPSDPESGAIFGGGVSISGDYAVISAVLKVDSYPWKTGAAYVFERTGSHGDLYLSDYLGDLGEVVEPRRPGVWVQHGKLLPQGGLDSYDAFGGGVTLSGDTALVGAAGDDDRALDAGAVYVFVRIGSDWVQRDKLFSTDPDTNADWGWVTALSGDTAWVGDGGTRTASAYPGAAYAYSFVGCTGTEQNALTEVDRRSGNQARTLAQILCPNHRIVPGSI